MKRHLLPLLLFVLVITSCGDDGKDDAVEQSTPEVVVDSIRTIEGEFIFLADKAVIKGPNFIYGIEIDSLATDLANRVAPLKQDDFDMIPVKIRAKVIPNPGQNGWDEIVQIREIIQVAEGNSPRVQRPSVGNQKEQE